MMKSDRYSLLLPLILVALVAVGCDRKTGDQHRISLIVAVPASASKDSPYEFAVAGFRSQHPEIDVEILPISGSYYQKLLVMIAGGRGPDVMWMGQNFSEFANRGIFLDLSEQLAHDFDTSSVFPGVLDWYRIGTRQYGIPFGIDAKFMVYNRRLFDEAGVPHPTEDWTLEQFMSAARRLTLDRNHDGRIDQFGFIGELDFALFGASIVQADGVAAACNSQAMIEFLQTNLRMRNVEHIALPATRRAEETLTLFAQNRAAIAQVATWDLPYMRQQLTAMDWDIVANPRLNEPAHWASSQAMVVRADTAHPHEAWLLCKAFLQSDFQRQTSEFSIPADRNIAAEVVARNSRSPANLQTLLVAARSLKPNPRVPRMMEVMQTFNDACESVFAGQASSADAMARAETQINRLLRDTTAAVR